ncbi:MAG: hypothetical protein GY793_06860 [Proteobacteria bacterium]|nr:hypothetical protein [Pseudomonadota bacterium]
MNFKVSNTQDIKKSSKKSKVSASKTESLGFADALQDAQSTDDVGLVETVANVDTIQPVFVDTGSSKEVPEKAKDRGYYILDLLEELEKDILLGKETAVSQKLENALKTQAKDIDELPQVVKDLMQEIELRASLELEKLKPYNGT